MFTETVSGAGIVARMARLRAVLRMAALAAGLVLGAGLTPVVALAQNLQLSFSAQPPMRGVVSTVQTDDRSFLVSSGQTLRFARAEGRESRLRGSGGFFWAQVQELPRDSERLEVTPRLREDGSIEVALDIARKEGTRLQSLQTTVNLQPGEWTQLYGPSTLQPRGQKTYGTQAASGEALYLRVDTGTDR
jgi:hypothetical protein